MPAALPPEERKRRQQERMRRWRAANREHIIAYKRLDYAKNREHILARQKELLTPEKLERKKAYRRSWGAMPENKSRVCENRRRWTGQNRDRANELSRNYTKRKGVEYLAYSRDRYRRTMADPIKRQRLREWMRSYAHIYNAARRLTDVEYRLLLNFRSRLVGLVRRSGTIKAGRTSALIGCTTRHLRQHLEKQFLPGMSWDNYGWGWHVDHILPCDSFDLTNPEEQRKCFHWTNLQPLWAVDNIRKGARLDWQAAA